MTDVRCIEHVIRDGSDFDGQKEWRVYISYEEGKQLFLPANLAAGDTFPYPHSSWYSIPVDCWAFQWNEAEKKHDYWWTMDENLARCAIEKYGWKVEVK